MRYFTFIFTLFVSLATAQYNYKDGKYSGQKNSDKQANGEGKLVFPDGAKVVGNYFYF